MGHKPQPRRYGLWDSIYGGWLGTDDGPLLFKQHDLALVAHTVHSIRLGWDGHRLTVKRYRERHVVRTGNFPDGVMSGHKALLVAEGDLSLGRALKAHARLSPMMRQLRDRGVTVHILDAGLPLCHFNTSVPRDWPEGHSWVRIGEEANCPDCINVAHAHDRNPPGPDGQDGE